jgi:hypothetical protein
MSKPFFFREAIVFDVDTKNLTCDLLYGDLNLGEMSRGVPMPNLIGSGNAGVIANLKRGTRVIAAYLHDTSRETVVIVSVLPSNFQKQVNYNEASEYVIDLASGTLPYPGTLEDGDVYLSAHTGPRIWMRSNNSLYLSTLEQCVAHLSFQVREFALAQLNSRSQSHLLVQWILVNVK